MKLSYLWHGLPGHPIHPPLTDATIGAYTFATVAALIQVIGITSHSGAYAWWLALVAGAIFSTVTVTTGFLDWLTIEEAGRDRHRGENRAGDEREPPCVRAGVRRDPDDLDEGRDRREGIGADRCVGQRRMNRVPRKA